MLSKSNKESKGYISWLAATFILVLLLVALVYASNMDVTSYGEAIVENLYTYKDDASRIQQKGFLQEICSEDVYAQITLKKNGNLYTFIDTARELTSVNIIKSTNDYIIYSLNSPQIDPESRYVLFYEVTNKKVTEVRECELYDFLSFDESLY